MSTETPTDPEEYVRFRIRFELRRGEKSQTWLAEQMGVPRDFISRRLRGDVPITALEIAEIAAILQTEVACFFPPRLERAG